jgi:hypothetical protein
MRVGNRLLSCGSCGVVVDYDNPVLDHETMYDHDQEKKCDAVRCPVCHELIMSEEWMEI